MDKLKRIFMDTSIDDRIIDPNGTDHDFYWVIDGCFFR